MQRWLKWALLAGVWVGAVMAAQGAPAVTEGRPGEPLGRVLARVPRKTQ